MTTKRKIKIKALKTLADLITQTDGCKQFCMGYSDMLLDVFLRMIQEEHISDEDIDRLTTIISLGERA